MGATLNPPPIKIADKLKKINSFFIAGWVTALGALYSDASAQDGLTRFSYSEYHMGIDARLVVYAPSQDIAEKACKAAFARIAELDSIMSDYRIDSELNKLCAKSGGRPVHVSRDLFRVFERAQEVSQLTGGAFDITAAPVVALWRKARKTGELPDPIAIASARKVVGWQKMSLDKVGHRVRLAVSGMKLDLGGIAKGYAGDEAQRVLKRFGIASALVEMGGDIVVTGPPPGTKGWAIRVANAGSSKPLDLTFANCAVSTSGDTEQFVVIGGKRYSHVVNPLTGWAVTNRVQATVVAPDGLTSDPLSKMFALVNATTAKRVMKTFGVTQSYVKVARD